MVKPEIAFIMRSDEMIKEFALKRITVDTSYGPVDRCFVGNVYNTDILVIYGRFNRQKTPSNMINYQQNIEAVKNMGISKLVGTYVVGGINPQREAGTAYVLGDLIGMGNYHIQVNQQFEFHNAEMYIPFCESLTSKLESAAAQMSFKSIKDASYVSFHGWPRIETKSELEFYHKMGWDIVGQTCDPEATVARLMGICYSAIAVQIDDPMHREKDIKNMNKDTKENSNGMSIKEYRKKTTAIILELLKQYESVECNKCNNLKRTNHSFKKFPEFLYE